MSDDEFDQYDLSEFTEQELREIDAHLVRAHPTPAIQIPPAKDSPFSRFLSRKKYLAVTDLVSPLWCEVQYEYSLYGMRNKPVHLRPPAFTSKSGKRIHVHQQVARANDRRLKRGKSVHKALETELYPVKSVVHVVSDEERFGLRLVQLIDGFTQLVTDGITRELPVFTITRAQVVLGIIDEVLCLPLPQAAQEKVVSPGPLSAPPTPPLYKKQRLFSSSLANQITFAPPTTESCHVSSSHTSGGSFNLHIIDYKTRQTPTIPLDEDSLSPRLQLMLYHRMLSSLLEPEAFDFDQLWSRLDLNPTKPFSAQFLKDVIWEQRQLDSTDHNVHLNRLVSEWISTVQQKRPGFLGVSPQLQLVYRQSAWTCGRDEGKCGATEPADIEDPLKAFVPQEELDLARAIEESLRDMGHEIDVKTSRHEVQKDKPYADCTTATWKDLVSSSDYEHSDSTLAWAIQQSLLTCSTQAPAHQLQQVDAKQNVLGTDETTSVVMPAEEQAQSRTVVDMSPIIGTRQFRMDDAQLDAHLVDVLQWWFGARPARGVGVSQTSRCFTCEYQDSCEWREWKANEAAALASARQAQRTSATADANSVWPTARAEAGA